MSEDAVSKEAYRDIAAACKMRASERDAAEFKYTSMSIDDHERRCELARLLGVQEDDFRVPDWPLLMTRLREVLCTYRAKPLPI